VAVIAMVTFVRQFFGRGPLPQDLSCLTIQAHHHEAEQGVRKLDPELPLRLILGLGRVGNHFAGVNGGGDEDSISPDNRTRLPAAGNFDLPFHVSVRIPFDRRIARRSNSGRLWTAPLVPILRPLLFKFPSRDDAGEALQR